jgi:predicted O-linked N-acetylglucosamine transferase (SPINDLY family)
MSLNPQTPPRLTASGIQHRLIVAVTHHRRGEVDIAEALYREILRDMPHCFDALHLLGIAATDRGAIDEGIDCIQRALGVDPSQAGANLSLARALAAKGDARRALTSVGRAIELLPGLADAWFLRGNLLQQSQRFEDAADSYERAITLQPQFPEALSNLAAALRALRKTGRAIECADRAIEQRPDYAKAFNNRGLALLDRHRQTAAVESFRRALAFEPEFAEALHNLGTALMQLRRFEEARDAFAGLAELAPGFPHSLGHLLHAKLCCCDWVDFERLARALEEAVRRGGHADVPMSFLNISGSGQLQFECARAYVEAHYPAPPEVADRPGRDSDGRIRIAYLSGDFGEHAVTYLLTGVFARHDLSRFETIALSWDRVGEGPARRGVEAAFSRFIDITDSSDAEAVQLMRQLKVDIVVDLTGHTLGQRTGILARRAAPVQVNYLGFPATMGAGYIDYLIADRFLVPEAQWKNYSEKIVWLPCFQPNDDRRDLAADRSRSQHGLPRTGFVFGSFNGNPKLNPTCFGIWMRILRSVPGSILWMCVDGAGAADNLRREALSRGVDGERLIFAPRVSYSEHLARLACADLCLDCIPFNGGATVSDALSIGVPVLTCSGESFAARMAGSLLSALGISELVTYSPADYVATAIALATTPQRLRTLRDTIVTARSTHSFFDTDRYRRHLEAAYQTMWERSMAGLPPAAFEVARA